MGEGEEGGAILRGKWSGEIFFLHPYPQVPRPLRYLKGSKKRLKNTQKNSIKCY